MEGNEECSIDSNRERGYYNELLGFERPSRVPHHKAMSMQLPRSFFLFEPY